MDESVTLTLPCYFGKYYPCGIPLSRASNIYVKRAVAGREQHSITGIGAIHHVYPARRVSTCRIILSIARAARILLSFYATSLGPNLRFARLDVYIRRTRVSRI